MMRRMGLAGVLVAMTMAQAFAVGVLVPKDEAIPPLAVKYLRVDAAIDDQMAKTVVEQVFQNSTDRDLEARYVFPLPAEASVRDFAMWINGQRTSGEIVEKQKAAEVYQSIVRRMRDPGLLEYLGTNLFRANVYPVPKKGTVRIQIEYGQVVPMEEGMAHWTFPLRTGEKASRTLEDFAVTVRLSSKVPLKSVYSPSHKVGIQRRDDHHATVGMEVDEALLDRDFDLYWSVSEKDFGLNLITHRPKGQPGYFLLLIAPRTEVEEAKVAGKDICFVLDVSGSMAGPKIEQAKKALRYCISRLRERDRFGLIAFSIETDALGKTLLQAAEENKKKAIAFVDGLEAQGGTDINAALTQALALEPHTVVFLTDGKPTVGETDTDRIVAAVEKNKGRSRVFVFGVDEQVNTLLLDRISETTGGTREYVTPGEDIEVKVTQFFNKASSPVLGRVSVDLPKVETTDVYPKEMPDLFKGQQVLVVGRYKNAASSTIVLRGEVEGEKRSFTYEGDFPEEATGNDFVEGLWARRKVGYLLDQIRLHGENEELKTEVVRLSRAHNIITPYTSYLVLESADEYKQHGLALGDARTSEFLRSSIVRGAAAARSGPGGERRMQEERESVERSAARRGTPAEAPAPARSADELSQRMKRDLEIARMVMDVEEARVPSAGATTAPADWAALSERRKKYGVMDSRNGDAAVLAKRLRAELDEARKDMHADSGVAAMTLSRELQDLKQAEAGATGRLTARNVAGRTMVLYHGFWVDSNWTADLERVSVKYGSDAYFALLAAEPKLKDVFKLGTYVIVVLPSRIALVVEDEGKETLSEEEIRHLLAPAKPAEAAEPAK